MKTVTMRYFHDIKNYSIVTNTTFHFLLPFWEFVM